MNLIKTHCRGLEYTAGWLHVLGSSSAEAIFAIRAWAIWGQGRNMAICISIAFIMYAGVGYVLLGLFLESVQFKFDPFMDHHLTGCVTIAGKATYGAILWIEFLAFEGFVTGILLIRGFQAYKYGNSTRLFNVLFQDGLIFYLYASGVAIVTTVLVFTLPPGLVLITPFPGRVIRVTITSRLLLRTREQASSKIHVYDENGNEATQSMVDAGHPLSFISYQSNGCSVESGGGTMVA
ncbi:hypothetical protein AMATHDRAFT_66689 [Amanita thiersii Skay4041]|uniref:Uncharacterized protein n=1 Tax=Amanita thiersii Skay4041 TaxID=703135 RepID=A0A2A9NER1_9AGAR|nr:hypothetical protein AMATHDRAFT_66689 [Amanita thiersii Skay4041]